MTSPSQGYDEFELIARLLRPLAAGAPGALDLADDAALVDVPAGRQLVVTADAIVAGVHFLPDDPPAQIARKLVRVNLSDLAAKGAHPIGLILCAAFPQGVDGAWQEAFVAGLGEDVRGFGVPLLGGDTVATPGPATFSLTALGTVRRGRMIRRAGALPGDQIWVSGTVGDAAFGLHVSTGQAVGLDAAAAEFLRGRYLLPEPRLELGRALPGIAHAAMDVSDGLVGDLGHICETSGVAAVIEAASLPLSVAARAAMAAGVGDGLATVLTGGDDYELLFTAPPTADRRIRGLSERLGLRLSAIGRIIPGVGVEVEGSDGRPLTLRVSGYRHFRA